MIRKGKKKSPPPNEIQENKNQALLRRVALESPPITLPSDIGYVCAVELLWPRSHPGWSRLSVYIASTIIAPSKISKQCGESPREDSAEEGTD